MSLKNIGRAEMWGSNPGALEQQRLKIRGRDLKIEAKSCPLIFFWAENLTKSMIVLSNMT